MSSPPRPDPFSFPHDLQERRWLTGLLLLVLAALWSWVYWRNAWVCDDAYITFRSVEQLVHGNGPRWNPGDRVQAFTHPLWFGALALVRLISGTPWWNAVVLSFALSTTALLLLVARHGWRPMPALLLLAGALSSKAFVDYSAGGLETPLTFALLAVFAGLLWRRQERAPAAADVRLLVLVASLLLLCRHDLLLIVALPVAVIAWQARAEGWRRLAAAVLVGSLPAVAWTAFSVIYYGFPFPNTAYAKLSTGVSAHALWRQGQWYLWNSLRWDPVTFAVCLAGPWVLLRSRRPVMVALGASLVLYLLYVVKVGGDFMAGRFLTPVFFAGLAALVARLAASPPRHQLAVLCALAISQAVLPGARLAATAAEPLSSYLAGDAAEHGIADEKKVYTARGSFRGTLRQVEAWPWRHGNEPVEVLSAAGWTGFNAGLDRTLIDVYALTDPLLARLPCEPPWRVGHYRRSLPAGYLESIESGENRLVNPSLHALYDRLRLVTRGPLFTAERWRAIVHLNLRYQRPACKAPPCRRVVTRIVPRTARRPSLGAGRGALEESRLEGPEIALSGWLPVPDDSVYQQLLVMIDRRPAATVLENVWRQDVADPLGPRHPLAGFRLVLRFAEAADAALAAPSICLATADGDAGWHLVPTPGGGCQDLVAD